MSLQQCNNFAQNYILDFFFDIKNYRLNANYFTKLIKLINDLIELLIKSNKYFILQIVNLTKQLDMTERQIERWWRRRKAQDKPTTLKKFCENVWRGMFYTYSFIFGMIVMWDKVWLWDIKQCWYSYPHQVCLSY